MTELLSVAACFTVGFVVNRWLVAVLPAVLAAILAVQTVITDPAGITETSDGDETSLFLFVLAGATVVGTLLVCAGVALRRSFVEGSQLRRPRG